MSRYQTKVVVSDDAIDFEKNLNIELKDIPADKVKNIFIRSTPDWAYYAVIVYLEG